MEMLVKLKCGAVVNKMEIDEVSVEVNESQVDGMCSR